MLSMRSRKECICGWQNLVDNFRYDEVKEQLSVKAKLKNLDARSNRSQSDYL